MCLSLIEALVPGSKPNWLLLFSRKLHDFSNALLTGLRSFGQHEPCQSEFPGGFAQARKEIAGPGLGCECCCQIIWDNQFLYRVQYFP